MSVVEILLAVLGSNAVTSYLTFLFSKKKYLAEASNSELEAVEKSISIYRGMVEDLGQRIDILSKNLQDARQEIEMHVNNKSISDRKIAALEREIKKLKSNASTDNNSQ